MDKDMTVGAPLPDQGGEALPKTALAFEIADGAKDTSEPLKTEAKDNRSEALEEAAAIKDATPSDSPEAQPKKAKKPAPPSTDIPEEFSIPDSFLESERNSHFTGFEDSFRIRTTYVPRFTEVSENYRVASSKSKPVSVERKEEKPGEIREEMAEKDKKPDSSAPLAATSEELEGKEVNHVVVTQTPIVNNEPKDESVRFFKFDGDDVNLPPKEEPPVPEEQAPPPEEKPAEEAPVEEKPTEEPKKPKDPSEYTIPDPASRVREITVEEEGEDPFAPPTSIDKSIRPVRREYNSPSQRDAFKDKFLDTVMAAKVRLVTASVFLLAALAMELCHLFGLDLLALIGLEQIWGNAAVALTLSAGITLMAVPELLGAIGYLVRGKLHPELYCIFAFLLQSGYTAFVVVRKLAEYPTFASLYCLGILVTVLSGLHRGRAHFRGFRIIAAKEMYKTVIDKRLTRDLPRENLALDGAVDEYRSVTARTFKANFISDYFTRSAVSAESSSDTVILTVISLVIAILGAVGSYFLSDGFLSTAVECGVALCLIGVPAVSILGHKLSYDLATRLCEGEGGAFVGESSLYSLSSTDVVTYVDTEIFGNEDVSLKKVHLYGQGENMDKAVRQMCAIFGVVGGPLDYHFTASMGRRISPITDPQIEDDGISGGFEGHRIAAGTEEYMRRHGILIPGEDYRTNSQGSDSTRIMYGAEDGRVYVKFFIRYSFSEEFSMLMPHYKNRGIVPLIYTGDPNLNNDFLKTLTLGEDLIRVMKVGGDPKGEDTVYRRVSAEAVILGERSAMANMILLSKRYVIFMRKLTSFGYVTALVSILSTLAISALVSLGILSSYLPLLGLAPFALSGLACIIGGLWAKRSFRIPGDENN